MTRTDRVMALLTTEMSIDEAMAAGVTVQDAVDVLSLLRLDLELLRAEPVPRLADLVRYFIEHLSD